MVFPFKIDRPTDLNRQMDLFRPILGYALLHLVLPYKVNVPDVSKQNTRNMFGLTTTSMMCLDLVT